LNCDKRLWILRMWLLFIHSSFTLIPTPINFSNLFCFQEVLCQYNNSFHVRHIYEHFLFAFWTYTTNNILWKNSSDGRLLVHCSVRLGSDRVTKTRPRSDISTQKAV
jgi:hypothetical protein